MSCDAIGNAIHADGRLPMLQHSPVIVLGMHRSGTSALAGGLEHLGLRMGQNLYPRNEWNSKGYFEEEEIVSFNNALLHALGRRWDTLLPAQDGNFERLGDRVNDAAEMLSRLFSTSPHWGFKDPRMCMLQPFWAAVFRRMRLTPKLLITVRDPREVAWSLKRRDGIAVARAGWLWLSHVIGALSYVREAGRARLIAFDGLLAQPAAMLEGIARWLALKPDAGKAAAFATHFIEPMLVHRPRESPQLPPLVCEAYAVLSEAAAAGMDPHEFRDSAPWQCMLARFEEQTKPGLLEVDRFFDGDRQLDFLEARNAALTTGLANAEELATQRLASLAEVDADMHRLNAAFTSAESLAHSRLQELGRLEAQCEATREEMRCATRAASVLEQEKRLCETQLQESRDAVAEHSKENSRNEALIAAMHRRLAILEQDNARLTRDLAAAQETKIWKVLKRLGVVSSK